MNIHILRCGSIQVSETVPYGNAIGLKNSAKQLTAPDRDRLMLPVCAYLIEHPRGLILVDTGWCREISPRGVYDPKAVRELLPPHLAALFHPSGLRYTDTPRPGPCGRAPACKRGKAYRSARGRILLVLPHGV